MKFLCDNCKAKYQIADEKVAGKTVRMKCRKCGHQIEVRAAITETSVSTAPPKQDAPPKPVQKTSSLATSLSAAKPASRQSITPGAASGALAGAFQRNVQDAPATVPNPGHPSPVDVSVTDEWYVAINGVPVGPVRISELRRKAGSGAVTEDSLCWQEGLEEWRPVRTFPELAAIVREAAQGGRISLIAPPPDARAASPAPAPVRSPPQRASMPPRAEVQRASEPLRPIALAPAPSARSNVVPLHARHSTPDRYDDAPPVTSPMAMGPGTAGTAALAASMPAPAPAPPPAPAVATAPFPTSGHHAPSGSYPPPAPVMAGAVMADPFALPPMGPPAHATSPSMHPSMASMPSMAPPPPSIALAPPPKRGVPLWFWPILLLSVSFGGVAAFFVFRTPPAQSTKTAPPPTSTPAPSTSVAATNADIPPPPPPSSAEPTTAPAGGSAKPVAVAANGAKGGAPTPAADPSAKKIDLAGLSSSGGGPVATPTNAGGGGGGGGLDQAAVERVVRERAPGVRRVCWERGGSTQGTVSVTVTATVGPGGNVVGTSHTGNDSGVGRCIENQVRTWQFPAPGATTPVNLPFKFLKQ